jgi:hypothetical protein
MAGEQDFNAPEFFGPANALRHDFTRPAEKSPVARLKFQSSRNFSPGEFARSEFAN